NGDDAGTARLTVELPEHLPGETTIWPLTAPRLRRPLAQSTTWELSLDEITPFLAVESVDGDGPARATRRCLLKVPLIGDVIDREQRALATMLNSRDRVLRYLALLLGLVDPAGAPAQEAQLESPPPSSTAPPRRIVRTPRRRSCCSNRWCARPGTTSTASSRCASRSRPCSTCRGPRS